MNALGPQVFCCFFVLGKEVLGRERSIGRSDGSTSLNLDTVLILFSEVSICIRLSHISILTFKNSSFLIGLEYHMWLPGAGEPWENFPVQIV